MTMRKSEERRKQKERLMDERDKQRTIGQQDRWEKETIKETKEDSY